MPASSYTLESRIKLNNGVEMPRVHLGVYLAELGEETENAVQWALEAGYRAVDSAEWYENERECGNAIRAFLESKENTKGLKREDIWFTTKLKDNVGYDATRKAIKRSLKECGLGYIDLYLIHGPYGGKKRRLECWKALEDAVDDGEIRAIGVSNFGTDHLQEIFDSQPRIPPAVNQIEVHPFNTRTYLAKWCQDHNIVVEAWAPLARARRMKNPKVVEFSKKYSRTPAQILIQWSLQHNYVPLPKSVTQKRIVENGHVGGFELTQEEMEALDAQDEYLVTDWDPVGQDGRGN